MLDEAMQAREADIQAMLGEVQQDGTAAEVGDVVAKLERIIFDYCKDQGYSGYESATMDELQTALRRYLGSQTAYIDQHSAVTEDLQRLPEILDKASFPNDGMTIVEIVSEMRRRKELSDEELREVNGIIERVPYIDAPQQSGE